MSKDRHQGTEASPSGRLAEALHRTNVTGLPTQERDEICCLSSPNIDPPGGDSKLLGNQRQANSGAYHQNPRQPVLSFPISLPVEPVSSPTGKHGIKSQYQRSDDDTGDGKGDQLNIFITTRKDKLRKQGSIVYDRLGV